VTPYDHCGYCGHEFSALALWPRRCAGCNRESYQNPTPVAVALVPVAKEGLLVVQRNLGRHKGGWALPGGFVDSGESWQVAAAREVQEETGVAIAAEGMRLLDVRTAGLRMLLFAAAPPVPLSALEEFRPCREVSRVRVERPPFSLCFPLHQEQAERFFAGL
jgi:8-oxo-dGTP pyrophosphatase MutT (NUDIX family)